MADHRKRGDQFSAMKFAWLEQITFDNDTDGQGDAVKIGYAISTYINRESGEAWPKLETLAERLRTNEKTIRRGIAWLEKRGHLTVKKGGKGHSNRYALKLHERTDLSGQATANADSFVPDTGQNCPDDRSDLSIMTGQNCPTNPLNEPIEEHVEEHTEDFDGEKRPSKVSLEKEFPEFWNAYPRKKSKATAEAAYKKARETTPPHVILAGAMRYAAERTGQDPQYTPFPAKWLNDRCWEDEVDERPRSASEIVFETLLGGEFDDQFAPPQQKTEFPFAATTGYPAVDAAFAKEPEMIRRFARISPNAQELAVRTLHYKGEEAARNLINSRSGVSA